MSMEATCSQKQKKQADNTHTSFIMGSIDFQNQKKTKNPQNSMESTDFHSPNIKE